MNTFAEPPIFIDRRELASLMDLDAYHDAVEAAFRAHAEGRTQVPMPLHIALRDGSFHAKGAWIAMERDYAAVKVNSNFPGNSSRGLATIQGAVLLYDARDGRLLAILDSMEITARRTAAASAVAARHLARPDSRTIAILGCGEQGRAQLAAIARVMRLERVLAWDIDAARAERFACEVASATGLEARAVSGIPRADIVVTATSSHRPFLERAAPGTFVAAVGADAPHKSEIHPGLMAAAKIVTDLTAQAAVMGDLHHAPGAHVHAELGEIVAGVKPGRTDASEITLFDSTGVAIQDVAAAAWAYERAISAKEIKNA